MRTTATPQINERTYYTVPEVARLLDVSIATVWRWIAAAKLDAYRVGPRRIRVPKQAIEAVIAPARGEQLRTGKARVQLAVPPAEELARRQALVEAILERSQEINIAPMTTAELVQQAREERDHLWRTNLRLSSLTPRSLRSGTFRMKNSSSKHGWSSGASVKGAPSSSRQTAFGTRCPMPSPWRPRAGSLALHGNRGAGEAIEAFLALGFTVADEDALITGAYELVHQHGCALYDAYYLALAEQLSAPFLTADRKLYDRLRHLPYVVWPGDYTPSDVP